MSEVWKTISGHPGYEVSCRGRVRSVHGIIVRSNGANLTRNGRILKPQIRQGYERVRLGHGPYLTVHSLVAAAFIGERPDGLQVNHINHRRDDNRVENLEYVTPSKNVKSAVDFYGRIYPTGQSHPMAKATEQQIRESYKLLASGKTLAEVSKAVGISATSIQAAALGRSWKHLGLRPLKRVGGRRKQQLQLPRDTRQDAAS